MTLSTKSSLLGAILMATLAASSVTACNKEVTDFDRCGCEYGEVCQVYPHTEGVEVERQLENYGTCISFPKACDGQLVSGDIIPSCELALCPEDAEPTLLTGEKPIVLCDRL